ncbi:hypothetical protein [Streptomyces halobius]|uniref:Secreted protein n=1 Tax=Streptomyces halobius TaxID=2879846 RepID=A0ABY4M2B7_9ACTN|nr:hypothetical protein [Streptomyces halobius]UQA91887.1 hypothetical protein K9S39_08485 [Streptomyces halobius]
MTSTKKRSMPRRVVGVVGVSVVTGLAAAVMGGSAQAASGDVLLPHPGPDGLVWVQERTGDGGVATGGADGNKPLAVTVACEGGGKVVATVVPGNAVDPRPVSFTVDCPADSPGQATKVIDAGMQGSFSVQIDASTPTIRWALTATQEE